LAQDRHLAQGDKASGTLNPMTASAMLPLPSVFPESIRFRNTFLEFASGSPLASDSEDSMTALPAFRQERRLKTAPSKVHQDDDEELPNTLLIAQQDARPTSPSLTLPGTRTKTRRVSFSEEPEEFQVRTPSGDYGTLSSSTQSTEAPTLANEAETPVRTPSMFTDGSAPWFPTTPTTPMEQGPGNRFPGCNMDDDDDDRQSADGDYAAPRAPALFSSLQAVAEPTYHQMMLAVQKAALEEMESQLLSSEEEVQKATLAQLKGVCQPFFEQMCLSLHGAMKAHVQKAAPACGLQTGPRPLSAPAASSAGAPSSLLPPNLAKEANAGSSEGEDADRSAAAAQKTLMVCRHWKCKGFCRLGDQCKFLHPEHKRGVGPSRKRGNGQRATERAVPATISLSSMTGPTEMQFNDARGMAASYHPAGTQASIANLEHLWQSYSMQYPCPHQVGMHRVCLAD